MRKAEEQQAGGRGAARFRLCCSGIQTTNSLDRLSKRASSADWGVAALAPTVLAAVLPLLDVASEFANASGRSATGTTYVSAARFR